MLKQLLYLQWGVEWGATVNILSMWSGIVCDIFKFTLKRWQGGGVELGATTSIFTMKCEIEFDRFDCTVRSVMGCVSYTIYTVGWNRLQQLLYLQWGVEWGATVYVFTVWSGKVCDSFEWTMRSGVGCDSYRFYSEEWNGERQHWVYSEDSNAVRHLLCLHWGVKWCTIVTVFTVRSEIICGSFDCIVIEIWVM